jgi:hypothetical protein
MRKSGENALKGINGIEDDMYSSVHFKAVHFIMKALKRKRLRRFES